MTSGSMDHSDVSLGLYMSVEDRSVTEFRPFTASNLYHSKNVKGEKVLVLYGCETWSLTLREEHRLRVFENRVLSRIFGPKREEDGSWRKLHNDELLSLYSSPYIVRVIKSRRMGWVGYVSQMR
jgi:hypothetical protein